MAIYRLHKKVWESASEGISRSLGSNSKLEVEGAPPTSNIHRTKRAFLESKKKGASSRLPTVRGGDEHLWWKFPSSSLKGYLMGRQ
jgi:hypothetical protein